MAETPPGKAQQPRLCQISASNRQHDFADMARAFEQAMRLAGFG
jgi:hypothetical protein